MKNFLSWLPEARENQEGCATYIVFLVIMSKGVFDLLTDIAVRCNVTSEKTLRKSKELIALLNSKQQLNCSDTCKVVVCLELASSLSASPLSREEAIKYSGCKKRIYTNFYNNISKLLNLDKIYSVGEICLLVGQSEAKEPANKLLEKYKNISQEDDDFEHPMYACAAVLAFCRANKIKINVTKLVEISRVKKIELEDLSKKFSPFLEVKNVGKKRVEKKIDALNVATAATAPISLEGDEDTSRKRKSVMTDEEYEEWKKRMLED